MMEKLTNEQIEKIHAALKKIGYLYVDILHEMTDHIASELELSEGDFDRNLKLYIGRNKKELIRFNKRNIFLAWHQSWKGVLLNILTVRFAALFGLLYLALTGVNYVIERETVIMLMFFVFCLSNGAVSFPEVHRMIKKKDQYSIGEGISILNVFVFFPGIFSLRYLQEVTSDSTVALYFTILLSLCAVMAFTKQRFKSQIRLRYNG